MPGLDSNTKLLLSLDGTDGDTSTTDESDSNHTIGFNGTAHIEDTEKKWGATSLQLDGDSDYLDIADSADWDVYGSNSDDWTIDFQARLASHTAEEYYLCQWEGATDYWGIFHNPTNGGWKLIVVSGGANIIATGFGGEITDSNWHHIALCKVSAEYGIYVDGTQVCYVSDASTDTYTSSLYIGARGDVNKFANGYLDEIRIQKSNYFEAAPNATPDDTITVPPSSYARDLTISVSECTELEDKMVGG